MMTPVAWGIVDGRSWTSIGSAWNSFSTPPLPKRAPGRILKWEGTGWSNVTEARRIFWRRLSGPISGAEVLYGGDMETYEPEDDEQEEFGKARYHRKLGGERDTAQTTVGTARVITSEFRLLCSTFDPMATLTLL